MTDIEGLLKRLEETKQIETWPDYTDIPRIVIAPVIPIGPEAAATIRQLKSDMEHLRKSDNVQIQNLLTQRDQLQSAIRQLQAERDAANKRADEAWEAGRNAAAERADLLLLDALDNFSRNAVINNIRALKKEKA